MLCIAAQLRTVYPAALTLGPLGFADLNAQAGHLRVAVSSLGRGGQRLQGQLGDDAHGPQVRIQAFQALAQFVGYIKGHPRVQGVPHHAVAAQGLNGAGYRAAHGQQHVPVIANAVRQQKGVEIVQRRQGKDRGLRHAQPFGKMAEYFLRRKREYRGHIAQQQAQDVPESRLGRAAFHSGPGRGVEAVLENVQIDGGKVGCRDLFSKKLHDYGPAWRILRPASVTDQIFIKANRIRSIETKGVTLIDEGIRAEFIAIVNYGIIGLIQLELGYAESADISNEEAMALYDKYAKEALELMLAKNHDYDEAWRSMRVSSYTDLILMKIYRTKQIESLAGNTLVSEGIDANYMDMINYSVFGLIKIEFEG